MPGNHMFAKIAMSQTLNCSCASPTARAVPPNIGYLAQQFAVRDADLAVQACTELNVDVFTPLTEMEVPGLGRCPATLVRSPGSAALQDIVQLL